MLSRERLQEKFLDLVKIYSPSKGEKEICDYLMDYFAKKGIEAKIDNAGAAYGGNGGNIVAHIPGDTSVMPICLAGHLDQIEPCKDVKPIIEGNIIRTDGTTTLGGDDKGAVAAILEILEDLEESGEKHRDLWILFTVSEEISMLGAKNFDASMLPCKDVVIADVAGPAGMIAYKAPAMEAINITFHGQKAHAGLAPEKGINAIVAASHAISQMHIGRIDPLTTSNIGRIEGGGATNVVTDEVTFTAEIRSHNMDKLAEEVAHMEACCKAACEKMGATYDFNHELAYPSLELPLDCELFNLTKEAMIAEGVEPNPAIIGGGSDANIFAGLGYRSALISTGMIDVHTVQEAQDMDELWKATKIMRRMLMV